MFQTPRSCSASAVSSTSSHSHLLLFVFLKQNFFSFCFFPIWVPGYETLWDFACLECLYLPSSLVDSLARCRILCSKSGVGKLWPKLVKPSPSLVLVNEEFVHVLISLWTLWLLLYYLAELNSYKKDHLTHKMWNIYYLS